MAFRSEQQAMARLPLRLSAASLALAVSFGSSLLVAQAAEPSPAIASSAGKTAGLSARPVMKPGAPFTQLIPAAPIKPPVQFADDTDTTAATVKPVSWYRYGYPSYAYYRGYGGWYGPWYGRGPYAYYNSPYYGYWGSMYRPYGYYNFSPYYTSYFAPYGYAYPYYAGYQPWGPYYTTGYPLNAAVVSYPPYAMGMPPGYGGCCYW